MHELRGVELSNRASLPPDSIENDGIQKGRERQSSVPRGVEDSESEIYERMREGVEGGMTLVIRVTHPSKTARRVVIRKAKAFLARIWMEPKWSESPGEGREQEGPREESERKKRGERERES